MQTEESILKCNTVEAQNVDFGSVEAQNVDFDNSKKIVHIKIGETSEAELTEYINDMVDCPSKEFLLSILADAKKIKIVDDESSDTVSGIV